MTDLHNLRREEKISLVQALWDDIANEQLFDNISIEHKEILEERIGNINSGISKFKSWSELQEKFKML